MTQIDKEYRTNNFDLIRLIAALQVVVVHSAQHLGLEHGWVFKILRQFPGVPIFFSVSGFLIFWTYSRRPKEFFNFYKNRFLRLYPALWLCLFVALAIFLVEGVISFQDVFTLDMAGWFAANGTFFQFFTPDLLRNWGIGSPNGSLWTICVEIQFYLIIPIVYKYINWSERGKLIRLLVLMAASLAINLYLNQLDAESAIRKLGYVSILPYLFYFSLGMLLYIYWNYIIQWIEGKFLYFLVAYIVYFLVISYWFDFYKLTYTLNVGTIIASLLLVLTCFSFAFSFRSISKSIIGHNDISYGVYLYHMLIVNLMVSHQILNWYGWITCLLSSIILGTTSWFLLERQVLKLK